MDTETELDVLLQVSRPEFDDALQNLPKLLNIVKVRVLTLTDELQSERAHRLASEINAGMCVFV